MAERWCKLGYYRSRDGRVQEELAVSGNHVTTETSIADMVDRIVSGFDPSQVLLFGSHARGAANEWSDVDLLVVMSDVTDKRQAAIEIRRSLADLLVSKDIVVTTPDDIARRGHVVGTVLHAAIRDGKVLYERP